MVSRTYAEYKGKIYKWNELLDKLNLDNDGCSSGRIQFYNQASAKQLENLKCLIKDESGEYVEICNSCEELINDCKCDINVSNNTKSKEIPKNCNITKRHKEYVWKRDVGNSKSGKCYVCNCVITDDNFETGHVISKHNNGSNHVSNLRAVCIPCNRAMGTTNLEEFRNDFTLKNFNKELYSMEVTKEDVIDFLETHKPYDANVIYFNKAIELLKSD